jgi:hypothetical protein
MDTSSLVRAWHEAYPIDSFPSFWDEFEKLINEKRIIAPEEVLHETKKRDDALHKWLKGKSGVFWPIDEPLQDEMAKIMAKFKFMVKNRPGKNAADPWVIALAKITGTTVVTEEGDDNSTRLPKIPLVCRHYKVPCFRLLELIRKEGWRF